MRVLDDLNSEQELKADLRRRLGQLTQLSVILLDDWALDLNYGEKSLKNIPFQIKFHRHSILRKMQQYN